MYRPLKIGKASASANDEAAFDMQKASTGLSWRNTGLYKSYFDFRLSTVIYHIVLSIENATQENTILRHSMS